MRIRFLLPSALLWAASALAQNTTDAFVLVEGGAFKNTKSSHHGKGVTVAPFYIGKYEVTQKEWTEVMGNNPSHFKGDNLPVEMVSWYDCVEYCNRRSAKEGLQPYYTIDKQTADPNNHHPEDDVKWTVKIHPGANGYRLPTELEWEYASGGGQKSQSLVYSGSNEVDRVAWYWQNSGEARLEGAWNWPAIERNRGKTHPVGSKEPNELGLYDMSGNVREWCWDWHSDPRDSSTGPQGPAAGAARVWKGGGWLGGDFCCESSFRSSHEPASMGYDQGLRLCRNP